MRWPARISRGPSEYSSSMASVPSTPETLQCRGSSWASVRTKPIGLNSMLIPKTSRSPRPLLATPQGRAYAKTPAIQTEARECFLTLCQPRLGQHAGEKGGEKTDPNPLDRGRSGSRRHLFIDANGTPLAVIMTAATHTTRSSLIVLRYQADRHPPKAGSGGRDPELILPLCEVAGQQSEISNRPYLHRIAGRRFRALI